MNFIIADEDVMNSSNLYFILLEYGSCEIVRNKKQIFDLLEEDRDLYSIMFMDICIGDKNSIDILKSIREKYTEFYEKLFVVFMVGDDALSITLRLLNNSKYRFIKKPINKADIITILNSIGLSN